MTSRWLFVIGLLMVLELPARAQLPTFTGTRTWTPVAVPPTATPPGTPTGTSPPTPTETGTPLPEARIKPEMIQWPTPQQTPVQTPVCVVVERDPSLGAMIFCLPATNGSIGGGQRACVGTGSIAAAAVANVCVTWSSPYLSSGGYVVVGPVVTDTPTGGIAALMVHHLTGQTTTGACALVFNQDAANARSGTLCMQAVGL
jgi:hypothetical protein